MTARGSYYLRILRYARAHRGDCAAVLALSLLASGLALLQPWPMKILIDGIFGTAGVPGPLTSVAATVPESLRAAVLIGLVALLSFVLIASASLVETLAGYQSIRLGRKVSNELAGDVFARLQRRSLGYHSTHTVGPGPSRTVGAPRE